MITNLKKPLNDNQILLVSTLGNVWQIVLSICILMLGWLIAFGHS